MLLIYSHKITPRLTYVFKHIFTRILELPVDFTTKIENFIAHDGLKLSYTKQALGNELFIKSSGLLFDQGIDYLDFYVSKWGDVPCFFNVSANSAIPYDIFAASFYLLSRYEEYLPHVKDDHERYPVEESLAFQNKFLDKPVIDIWAFKLKEIILEKYPDFKFKERKFKYISTIDVDIAYSYKYKGVVRSIGGVLKDLSKFHFEDVINRFLVLFNAKTDPYDSYKYARRLHRKYNTEALYFFLVGDYSSYDKNISFNNTKYKLLIKDIADYAKIGLHPSYFTMKDEVKMKKEKKRLESIVNFPITRSRQHFLRAELPETYQYLVDLEIQEEYSMVYPNQFGFRAGTCTPFYFYDLDFEIQTPLKVVPVAAMDGTFKDYLGFTTKRSFDTMKKLAAEVKKVGGTYVTIFHNESLGGSGRWKGWSKNYEELLALMHDFSKK